VHLSICANLSSYATASRTTKKISLHHCKNRTIKHVTKLKINGEVTYMNDVGYYTFVDEVTVDPLSKCSYNQ
jgi:hypothetical protein